jgi:diguanylate cyclase
MPRRKYSASDPILHRLLAEALVGDPAAAGFEVRYQPIVRLDDSAIVAVEALARWDHRVAGTIAPEVFVAGAEQIGLIGVLDDFVLDRACDDANALEQVYGRDVRLHVNVSASRLARPDLDAAIASALSRHHLPPYRLTLEITETSRISDLNAAVTAVQRIRNRGVRIALDDFGSGFNGLEQLYALPIDIVKLGVSLTRADVQSRHTQALRRLVLSICRRKGIRLVAEGIETLAQAFVLRRMGCQLGQGYLYGAPFRLEPRAIVHVKLAH